MKKKTSKLMFNDDEPQIKMNSNNMHVINKQTNKNKKKDE